MSLSSSIQSLQQTAITLKLRHSLDIHLTAVQYLSEKSYKKKEMSKQRIV